MKQNSRSEQSLPHPKKQPSRSTISTETIQLVLRRPLSLIAAVLAVLMILYQAIQIAGGHLYRVALVDGTTMIELGILTLLGIYTLRDRTDLQAISFTLVAGLSFIFFYEAIYKWSFYLAPFRGQMPPNELREFIIQVGIAAMILTGFATGLFRLKKWTFIWLGIFVALWIFWLLIGFPQIGGGTYFPQVIDINLTYDMNYILNRTTKLTMYLAYVTLFPLSRTGRQIFERSTLPHR